MIKIINKYSMQRPKKKPNNQIQKRSSKIKKPIVVRVFSEHEKTLHTTKQVTHATMEEQAQTFQTRVHTLLNSNNQRRRTWQQKLQALDMSPFSSNQRKSVTPKIKKLTIEDILKENKKCKKGVNQKKRRSPKSKKICQSKQKIELSPRIRLENSILRLYAGKITQQSYESYDADTQKTDSQKKLSFSCKKPLFIQTQYCSLRKKLSSQTKIYQMHTKIKNQCKINYPTLAPQHQKFLSCVVLVQRLWRQKKVKEMMKCFTTPKSQRRSFEKAFKNDRQIRETGQTISKSVEKIEENISNLNLADLQISKQLSNGSNRQDYQRFVENYRQFNIMQLKKKKSKESSFNFPISMSEKCLMEKFYRKVFKASIENKEKVNFFASPKKIDKEKLNNEYIQRCLSSQKRIDIKQSMLSDTKPQNLMAKFEQFDNSINPQAKAQLIQKHQQPILRQDKAQQKTLQRISEISSTIVQALVQQFIKQFSSLRTNQKQHQKKRRLPGIQTSGQSIRQFLKGFSQFIQRQHMHHLQSSFEKVNSLTFLKICRPQPLQYLFEDEEEQQISDWSLLPNNVFFDYQNTFQRQILSIKDDDKKYENFILSLSKVHNKCLHDALLQCLQRNRSYRVIYRWDHDSIKQINKKSVPQLIKNNVQEITEFSDFKLGSLYKRRGYEYQDEKIRQLQKYQITNECLEWSTRDQRLQYRLELTDLICDQIMSEIAVQLLKIKADLKQGNKI